MIIAIYEAVTGKIYEWKDVPPAVITFQVTDGFEFYLNCPKTATHIINNEPVCVEQVRSEKECMAEIRRLRAILIQKSDWTQFSDSPLTAEKKAEWATYRQLLRDFPETCNLQNPVWPTPPY